MDRISFEYSTKNIPTAPRSAYLKRFIEKSELFMKRMRWKALFFLNPKSSTPNQETYGFNTAQSPPVIEELREFEDCMISLIQNIEFESKTSVFQAKLHQDLETVKHDNKLTIKADKTTNYYKIEQEKYSDLVKTNVNKTYKKDERG
ncbi:hypothetical protein QZH41_007014 [Actinostola sp. cb2023]|nr:hypothetical protein QZH41_007014 [Actinostola sp. cb2023]